MHRSSRITRSAALLGALLLLVTSGCTLRRVDESKRCTTAQRGTLARDRSGDWIVKCNGARRWVRVMTTEAADQSIFRAVREAAPVEPLNACLVGNWTLESTTSGGQASTQGAGATMTISADGVVVRNWDTSAPVEILGATVKITGSDTTQFTTSGGKLFLTVVGGSVRTHTTYMGDSADESVTLNIGQLQVADFACAGDRFLLGDSSDPLVRRVEGPSLGGGQAWVRTAPAT